MSKFHFDRKAQKFRASKGILLERMANNAVNTFKVDAFDKRGLNGKSWTANKTQTGSQQLVNTGRMRQSITILQRTSDSIIVGSNVPYAKYHNEGAKNLPERKFIGNDRNLEAKNKKLIFDFTSKIV